MNNRDCDRLAPWKPNSLTKSMICATGRTHGPQEGTCIGDSGGPLMVKGNEEIVIGVTSWGTTNCNENAPSVFARVSNQLQWIKANAEREGRICIK